ncbi:MAG: hypothetical protein LBC68_03660 [Prevotellaceae bacterium]|jgi:hypothetical protein|nr:hypothetical protein [Prevotellaceae bacterium]
MMKEPSFQSETELRVAAMKLLTENLGVLNAERFINIIMKDKFNYTEWQRNLWKDKTIEEINQEASEFFNKRHPNNQ